MGIDSAYRVPLLDSKLSRLTLHVVLPHLKSLRTSTEAVPTRIERQMFARVLMLGNIVISISLLMSSVNWEYRVPFGCFDR